MFVITCPDCLKPMTLHESITGEGDIYICKHCGSFNVLPPKSKARRRYIKKLRLKEKARQEMICPICGQKLNAGELRNYETLTEHCCDPNDETIRLRRTYICNNQSCEAYHSGFWGCDYGWYGNHGIPDLVSAVFDKEKKRNYDKHGLYIGKLKYNGCQ